MIASIGARSFVNRPQTRSNTIIAGIPAKVVRTNINWVGSKLVPDDDEDAAGLSLDVQRDQGLEANIY